MFEIRNYHFDQTKFDEYRPWADTLAVPYLKSKMDFVGFWVSNEMPPLYGGAHPQDESVGPANITWIIRWQDRAQRDDSWEKLHADTGWQAIISQVPGGRDSYLRTEVKFATEI